MPLWVRFKSTLLPWQPALHDHDACLPSYVLLPLTLAAAAWPSRVLPQSCVTGLLFSVTFSGVLWCLSWWEPFHHGFMALYLTLAL